MTELPVVPTDPRAAKFVETVQRLDARSRAMVATLAEAIADPAHGKEVTERIGKIVDREYPTREAWEQAIFEAIVGES